MNTFYTHPFHFFEDTLTHSQYLTKWQFPVEGVAFSNRNRNYICSLLFLLRRMLIPRFVKIACIFSLQEFLDL